MRFKQDKDNVLSCIAARAWNTVYEHTEMASNQRVNIADVISMAIKEAFAEFLNQEYTDEDFERDISIR